MPEPETPNAAPPTPPATVVGTAVAALTANPSGTVSVSTLAAIIALAVQQFIATEHANIEEIKTSIAALQLRVAGIEADRTTRADADAIREAIRAVEREADQRSDKIERDQARTKP